MRRRLLIISHDVVGKHMAGPGIRYWELARALAPHAQVTLIAPRPIDVTAPHVVTGRYTWGDAASLAAYLAQSDVILLNGLVFAVHPELEQARAALIIDLYDPILLENLELLRPDPVARAERARADAALLQHQIAVGDFFLCATERQRDLYIGALMAAGRITPTQVDADPLLRGLIDVVPFGLSAEPPVRSGPGPRELIPAIDPSDPLILWSGGLWDWMDPQTLIQAMPAVLAAIPNARLVFMAGKHPGPASAMRTPAVARALAADLGLLDQHIFFYEAWVPYAERVNFLLDATVVVSLHRQHLETAYAAVRSRFLDHLWAGRVSIVSAGDAAATLVADHDIGRVVPIGDTVAVAHTIVDLLSAAAWCEDAAQRSLALAATFTWDRVSSPIRTYCTTPYDIQQTVAERYARRITAHPTESSASPRMDGTMNEQTRNDTISRLDQLWKLEPQPLDSPIPFVREAKEKANSLTRWYVQPLIDQQNRFNASVVHAIQALAASDDRRHSEVTNLLSHTRHTLTMVQQRLEEVVQHSADIDDAETALTVALAELRDLITTISLNKEDL